MAGQRSRHPSRSRDCCRSTARPRCRCRPSRRSASARPCCPAPTAPVRFFVWLTGSSARSRRRSSSSSCMREHPTARPSCAPRRSGRRAAAVGCGTAGPASAVRPALAAVAVVAAWLLLDHDAGEALRHRLDGALARLRQVQQRHDRADHEEQRQTGEHQAAEASARFLVALPGQLVVSVERCQDQDGCSRYCGLNTLGSSGLSFWTVASEILP